MKIAPIVRTSVAGFLMIVVICACSLDGAGPDDSILIRIGESQISAMDFQDAMEIRRSAYPHQESLRQVHMVNARKRLLDQMTEELLLLERARNLGLDVTGKELEQAVADFKRDYPDDVFQEMLLENAIPYHAWKEGIRKKLVMEKVIQADLGRHLAITSEEVSEYYRQVASGAAEGEKDSVAGPEISSEKVVAVIRRKKLEQAYPPYLDTLKKRYTIDVNQALWAKLCDS